jgi:hypothetical protein
LSGGRNGGDRVAGSRWGRENGSSGGIDRGGGGGGGGGEGSEGGEDGDAPGSPSSINPFSVRACGQDACA